MAEANAKPSRDRLMDVIDNLTQLRDMVRRSVEFFDRLELSTEQTLLLEERRQILHEIEADIERLRKLS